MTEVASQKPLTESQEGLFYQIAAEFATETKRVIPADAAAIRDEEYGPLVISGLIALSHQPTGADYHGVDARTATNLLDRQVDRIA